MPLRAGVEQMHGARRALARDLDARHLVPAARAACRRWQARACRRRPSVNGASPRRWPRADMACSVPARGPALGPQHLRIEAAARRHAGDGAERLLTGTRVDHGQPAAGEAGELVGKLARRAVVVDAVGEPDHDRVGWRRRARVAMACAAATRSGAEGLRLHGGRRRAGRGRRLDLEAERPSAALAVGAISSGRLWPSASAIRRSIMKVRAPHCAAAAQPLSTTSTTGPEPESAFSLLGLSTGSASARITSAAAAHADQRQPPGRLRRRLLAVLDADEDAGRRKLDARRGRGGMVRSSHQITGRRQQTGEQPGAQEGDGPERHGAPPARDCSVCDFQR